MTSQAQLDQDTRKVEASKLLEQANNHYEAALKSYQQAQDIYHNIGEQAVATLISRFVSRILTPTIPNTGDIAHPNLHLSFADGIDDNPPTDNDPQ